MHIRQKILALPFLRTPPVVHLCKQAGIHTASSSSSRRNSAFLASPWINKLHRRAARRAKTGLEMTGLFKKTWAIQQTYVSHFAEDILRATIYAGWNTCLEITCPPGNDTNTRSSGGSWFLCLQISVSVEVIPLKWSSRQWNVRPE